jgi:hypothetical protein
MTMLRLLFLAGIVYAGRWKGCPAAIKASLHWMGEDTAPQAYLLQPCFEGASRLTCALCCWLLSSACASFGLHPLPHSMLALYVLVPSA